MRSLASKLSSPATSQQSEDEKSLSRLAGECEIVADQIVDLLNKIKPKDPKSRRQSACTETKNKLDYLIKSAKGNTASLGLLRCRMEQLSRGVTVTSIAPEAEKRLREILHLSEEAYEKTAQQCILNSLSFDVMYGRFEAVDKAHYKTFDWIFEDTPKGEDNDRGCHTSETFIHWLSSGKGIFHVSGKLGSGKSTLMKYLCSHKRTKAELRKWAARPELIPTVLPHQWTQVTSTPHQSQTGIRLSSEDIRAAFSRLIELPNLYKKHCFCFFIDGLDEYENTRQEDYKDMVNLLISWTEAAPEDVKICVSSREYNVFLSSFSDQKKLRVQDLTRGDMERYVRDRLGDVGIGTEAETESLVKAVADKASGIFLWVALVVKSLRERLEDGFKLASLERELEVLPVELEDLFKYLLQSIDKSALARAYRTFAILLRSTTYQFDLSLDSYYFLDDYETDPEFAIKPSFGMSEPSMIERRDIARKRLNGCCRGLAELGGTFTDFTVAFGHRSIPEFLEKDETRRNMNSHLRTFSPENALSQLFLAELRSADQYRISTPVSTRVYLVIRMLYKSKADCPPYRWRELLHSTLLTLEDRDAKGATIGQGTIWTGPLGLVLGPDTTGVPRSPLYTSALLGDYEYIAWKLAHDPTIIDADLKKSWLLGWVARGAIYKGNPGCFRILDLFLKLGALSPKSMLHTKPLIRSPRTDVEMTFWQTFIIQSAFAYIPEHDTGSLSKTIYEYGREYHYNVGAIIEKFLRLGADPHVWIWVPDKSRFKELAHVPSGYCYGYRHLDDCEVIFGRERRKIVGKAQIAIETLEFIDRKDGRITFRDLVLFWRLDNTDTLLELIDKGFEQQEEPVAKEGMIVLQTLPQTERKPTLEEREEAVKVQAQALRHIRTWFGLLPQSQFATFLFGVVFAVIVLRLWPA
ncbi:hypothetical protein CC80DRAFT_536667 [Byssothecium circinans]|uniref:DUF7791 domain-containing protein n=1 Tax=Byssothecium circinans TaxID=147558 RepID=A0A6A5TP45_9PLEO|nr:hypothetical protein CC80DRAFT_536667 [Byssothecium circinans]